MPEPKSFMQKASWWELEELQKTWDLVVIGAGFTGLCAAWEYHLKRPHDTVLIIDKQSFGALASTKNAGFGCFGSPSELLEDLKVLGPDTLHRLVEMRYQGIMGILKQFKEGEINLKQYGGFEYFPLQDYKELHEVCINNIQTINDILFDIFKSHNIFIPYNQQASSLGLMENSKLIYTQHEFQLDPFKLWQSYRKRLNKVNHLYLPGVAVNHMERQKDRWTLLLDGTKIKAKNVVAASNALSTELFPDCGIKPARAQVLITGPINTLKLKGNFHLNRGYYYFRNVGANRILLGGARHLYREDEETGELGNTDDLMRHLEDILSRYILPLESDISISHRWSGIMGIGENRFPTIKLMSKGLISVFGMGGMGVALSAQSAREAVNLLFES